MRFKPTTNGRTNWVDVCFFPNKKNFSLLFSSQCIDMCVCVCVHTYSMLNRSKSSSSTSTNIIINAGLVSMCIWCVCWGFFWNCFFFSSLFCHSDYCRNIPHCAGVYKRDETACACLCVHDRCVSVTCTELHSCMACGEQYFNRLCWQHIEYTIAFHHK